MASKTLWAKDGEQAADIIATILSAWFGLGCSALARAAMGATGTMDAEIPVTCLNYVLLSLAIRFG